MTFRITDPKLDDTRGLLEQVLPYIVRDERVCFCVKAGESELLLARLRVMISRLRKDMQARGKKYRQFRLRHTIHGETHAGIRMDAIVLWSEVTDRTQMFELLQDVMHA